MVAAVQAGTATLINLNVGSVYLAMMETVAAQLLWLQGLVVYVLTLTRAATSSGKDLDSFVADFGLTRLAANYATGVATFARFTTTTQAVVPFNTPIQTADGTQNFLVEADPTNAAYNAGLGGYVLSIGTSSVSVPVIAITAGSAGNVLAGTVTSINQAVPGIDTVTNASGFINGLDAETDQALRIRFVAYFASLSKATAAAIGSAIENVQQGLQFTLSPNVNYSGATQVGYFVVVIDDGSGAPSSSLLTAVALAINAVVALTVTFGVFAPVVITATPSMTLTTASGYVHATVVAQVVTALQNAINGLGLGNSLPYTRLAAIAYSVPGVTNVSSVLLNGGTADLTADALHTVKCGTVTVG
jgi:uncharacterized phage protein gp47/JayE